jgi:uncharacterized protein (TIGR03085 family)
MPDHVVTERRALAETLRRAGPDAGTLSGEWSTAQLAAHLVARERSVIELAGRLPVPGLQRRSAAVVDDLARTRPYGELVDTFAAGPSWRDVMGPVPVAWLWTLPPVRERANALEYLIHHEDVRRAAAGWRPRELPAGYVEVIWTQLHLLARMTLRAVPLGVVLRRPDGAEIRSRLVRRGATAVTVTGDPVELALFAFGRGEVAEVGFEGRPSDVEAVRTSDISL